MVSNTTELKHDPRSLDKYLFDHAKRWMVAATLCRLGTFVIGIGTVLLGLGAVLAAILTTLVSVGSELCQWRSDFWKGKAEDLLRKLDLQDGLGYRITKAELSDLLIGISAKARTTLTGASGSWPYFASTHAVGARRALENIQESAWKSKHIAATCTRIYFAASCIMAAGGLLVLLISLSTIRDFDILATIARVVASVVTLIFSLGLFRLTIGYHGFSIKAAQSETRARELMDVGELDEGQAIKVIHDYHLARATAPLLPSSAWKWMGPNLDALWNDYRAEKSQHPHA